MFDPSDPVHVTIAAILGLIMILAVIAKLAPRNRAIRTNDNPNDDNPPFAWKHTPAHPEVPTPRGARTDRSVEKKG